MSSVWFSRETNEAANNTLTMIFRLNDMAFDVFNSLTPLWENSDSLFIQSLNVIHSNRSKTNPHNFQLVSHLIHGGNPQSLRNQWM